MEITEGKVALQFLEHSVNEATIESNNGGRGFARNVERILKEKYGSNKTVIGWFHQSQNKKARILTNASWVQEHIYYPETWMDKYSAYYEAMQGYQKEGKNAHDDAPDATTGIGESITGAIKVIKRGMRGKAFGGQFDVQHMQTAKQQSPTSMYSDQQGRRGLAEQLHGADGVLSDDRIRNTVIENHRRTTAAITATTNSVAAATAEFRRDAKENYPSLISTIKGNGERTDRLSANTKVIIDNTDTISRIGKKYSDLYRADQWQSQGDEPNYNELRGRTGENLNHTTVSLVTSSQSSAEFARNVRTIEANIVQMKELKKEMEQPQPKQDRGMNFGM